MDAIRTFVWLLVQAVEVYVIVLPIFLGLVLNLIVSQLRAGSSGRDGFMPSMLAPLVWPFAILAVASVLRYDGRPGPDAPSLPIIVVVFLFILQVAHSFQLIAKNQGNRWSTWSVELLISWFSVACMFMASMSLSNDWM